MEKKIWVLDSIGVRKRASDAFSWGKNCGVFEGNSKMGRVSESLREKMILVKHKGSSSRGSCNLFLERDWIILEELKSSVLVLTRCFLGGINTFDSVESF